MVVEWIYKLGFYFELNHRLRLRTTGPWTAERKSKEKTLISHPTLLTLCSVAHLNDTQLDFVRKFGVLSFSHARFIRHFRVLARIQLPMTIDHTMKLKRVITQ